MKLVRLFNATFSLSLRRSLAHRINLAFDLAQSFLGIGSVLAVMIAVYHHTQLLAGWTKAQTLVLTGIFALVTGLRMAFIDPSLTTFINCIRDGTIEEYLLRPAPSWFTTTCRDHAPFALGQSLVGVGIIVVGVVELPSVPTPVDILVTAVLVGCAVVITWSVSLTIACTGFWAARFELGPLVGSLWDMGRYPADIYRQPLRTVVTFVIPMAGMITLPASALAGRSSVTVAVVGLALAGIVVLVARLLFHQGIKRYTGATS